ncbi:hypothetical protein [Nonomuraea sp. NPDC050783]|uniref:hypothetical protein n=1 Tax=Nonomuraea sp. NPDC050783 TaxID=3154634 RepID=UPI003467807E
MRPIASAVIAVALAALAAGCAKTTIDTAQNQPQNEGGNGDASETLHVRNAFLLGSADPASPAPQDALYVVLINNGHQPARLQSVTVEGGGQVQIPLPMEVPPNRAVGVGEKPIGTVSGVRGGVVPMTFTFAGAPPVRVMAPVKPKTGYWATLPAAPSGSPTPTTKPSSTPTTASSPAPVQSPSPNS